MMLSKILPYFLLILSFVTWSQPNEDTLIKVSIYEPPPNKFEVEIELPDILPDNQSQNEDTIVQFPDIYASFPGGNDSLALWIRNTIDSPSGVTERTEVVAKITITENGVIDNYTINSRNVFDVVPIEIANEVKRLLSPMPNWIPASRNGEKVASYAYVRFVF